MGPFLYLPVIGAALPTHIYFDFFGTLVDYDPGVHTAGHNAPHAFCDRMGLSVSAEESDDAWAQAWAELDGRAEETGVECSMQHIAERFAAIVGLSPTEEETDALIADYLEAWSLGVTLAEEALDCVRRLAADYRVAVVSNTHAPELVPGLMRRLGLDVLIPDVFTSVEIGWRKPHPSIYQHVVATDRVDAGDAVFVGDNPIADVAGPRAFGMTAFHITREPLALFPDAVTLGELPALIRQLPERASNSQ